MNINEHNTHILKGFEYYAPETVGEAARLLAEHGSDAVALAGGTDIIPKMKQAVIKPRVVINLKRIPGLKRVTETSESYRIGALTRIRDIEHSKTVAQGLPLLHEAARHIGSVQIRNLATVGGNLCNASPAADSAQALIALDAEAVIASSTGERSVPLEKFFTGPGKTVLGRGEILKEITVPKRSGWRGAFIKLGRVSLDLATVSIAVNAQMRSETVEDIRVVVGSVAPTPLRLHSVEKSLIGVRLTDEAVEKAGVLVSESIKPISDARGSAEYRRLSSKGLAMSALMRVRE